MTPPFSPSPTRWVRSSPLHSIAALIAGLMVVGIQVGFGPLPAVIVGVGVIPLLFLLVVRATLYPQIYRARLVAMIGLLFAFLGFSHSAGELAYSALWRRAFQLRGPQALFRHPTEGWTIEYPGLWKAFDGQTKGVTTTYFKPNRLTPAIEFSLMHRVGMDAGDAETAARIFLAALPKSSSTRVLTQRAISYPMDRTAFELAYEDPSQALVLRHRLVFLKEGADLFILSVAAVPVWIDRLSADADRFLFSFKPIG